MRGLSWLHACQPIFIFDARIECTRRSTRHYQLGVKSLFKPARLKIAVEIWTELS
jgi:hypothetical protein